MTDMNKKDDRLVAADDGMYLNDDKILDFVPKVIAVTEIQAGNEVRTQYDIEIDIQGKSVSRVTVQDLYVKSWYRLSRYCPDAGITDKIRKMLERYLQEQAAQLPAIRTINVTKRGWNRIDGSYVYCHDDTIICGQMDSIHLESPGHNIIYIESFAPDIADSRAVLEKIEETAKGTSWILYIVSFCDILKEPFRRAGYPIEFITNVYGYSGSGKTSLVKMLCSPSQIFSFRSQDRRDTLLRKAKGYGGHTVLFDDFHPAESKADSDRQRGIKDSLVRMVEEVTDAPNIIISSEYLDGHLSLQDREIQIFLDRNMDWDILDELAKDQDHLEKIRIMFYVQIVRHVDDVITDIRKFCKDADSVRSERASYRNARYFDHIRCVDYLFHRYFIRPYGINLQCDIDASLNMHMEEQERHMGILARLDWARSYLPIIYDMLLHASDFGLEQVMDWQEFIPDSKSYHVNKEGHVSISKKALQRGLMRFLRVSDLPMKKIVREMVDADVIIPYDQGSEYTQKHKGKRYYKIDTDELEESCSIFNDISGR